MQILTHRGLEPGNTNFPFYESSKEAFINHMTRGFGLEFDINFSIDNWPFICHDIDLLRISGGIDQRKFSDMTKEEIESCLLPGNNHFIGFKDLVEQINYIKKNGEYSACHLKSKYQEKYYLDILIEILLKYDNIEKKIFLFDVKIETAIYIKSIFKGLKLFPSVSHQYDIERFNYCTGGTLLSMEEVIAHKNIFDGVWLDEWDRKDQNRCSKKFYTKELFKICRELNFKIGIIAPELHCKSPGLLGGESHEDAINNQALKARFQEIVNLKPDFICSDYF